MARVPITVMGFRCERCGYEWVPRDIEQEPKNCPRCKSPYWNRPRKNASPTGYPAFCNAVRTALEKAGRPLTWTEIRTASRLPQKLPNNQWVRRMESEIALRRERDKDGIIRWKLDNGESRDANGGAKAPD
jgi:hypothetical protein